MGLTGIYSRDNFDKITSLGVVGSPLAAHSIQIALIMTKTTRRAFIAGTCLALTAVLCCSRLHAESPQERPQVLVIGDSISLGYTPVLQGMLKEQVEITRPPNNSGGWINCQGTKLGVSMIDEWLALGEFDVIHFNFGLHDLKHVHPETGQNSNDPTHPQQSNLEEYEKNLREIVAKLKATDAKLIFATTTPYPDKPGGPLRRADQPAKYNQVALQIMKENDIHVNDLHGLVLPRMDELLLPNNVHFRPSANLILAEQVATEIKAALK